jgi:16S rRNA (adenine1518-N6/adenine1519-N6)-dimethyltransferase
MRLLVESAGIHNNDIVLEVGCGTGSLTEELVQKAGRVVVAELDDVLAAITEKRLAKQQNVEVLDTDVLESKNAIDKAVLAALRRARGECSGRLMLVANMPYGAASPVMLNLVTGPVFADSMYVTIQKEVAERMTAAPGSKHYGTLSIFLAITGEVKIVRILRPSVFWPQPEVDSAMVSFVRDIRKARRIHNMEIFSKVVALFMQHRRKMLSTCVRLTDGALMKVRNWHLVFEDCGIDAHKRPDALSPDEYLAIANICYEQLS